MDLSHRSNEREILDDFDLQGNDLSENLRELKSVNSYLGGYSVVLNGLKTIFKQKPNQQKWHVVDVGCGGGDTLRKVFQYFKNQSFKIKLTGVDANSHAIAFSKQESLATPEIEYIIQNIFSKEFEENKTDVYLFNLFLHHFEDDQILKFIKNCHTQGAVILINDLQRSSLAYYLFRLSSKLLRFSRISRHDGLLSIKKAFKRADWEEMMDRAGIDNYTIEWCWAFRYRVIVY